MSDVNDNPVPKGLVEILRHSSVALDEAEMREALLILERFLADLNGTSPVERAFVYQLANLADGRIRAMLGSRPVASGIDTVFPLRM